MICKVVSMTFEIISWVVCLSSSTLSSNYDWWRWRIACHYKEHPFYMRKKLLHLPLWMHYLWCMREHNLKKKKKGKRFFLRVQMPVNNTLICIFKLKGDSSYYQFKVEYVNVKLCSTAANCQNNTLNFK